MVVYQFHDYSRKYATILFLLLYDNLIKKKLELDSSSSLAISSILIIGLSPDDVGLTSNDVGLTTDGNGLTTDGNGFITEGRAIA